MKSLNSSFWPILDLCKSPSITEKSLQLRVGTNNRRGIRKTVKAGGLGHLLLDSVYLTRKKHSEPQQHGGLKKISMTAIWDDMPAWKEKIPQGPYPRRRATGSQWLLGEKESVFSRDGFTPSQSNLTWSVLETCTYQQCSVDTVGCTYTCCGRRGLKTH